MTATAHREARDEDVAVVCTWPQTPEELFFLLPKATYPLTPDQLARAIAQRFDSTVVLLHGEPAGFANFYVRRARRRLRDRQRRRRAARPGPGRRAVTSSRR